MPAIVLSTLVTFAPASLAAAAVPTLTTIAFFPSNQGHDPFSNVVLDSAGNIYGTTNYGGTYDGGTVYKIAAGTHAFSTLVNFTYPNGIYPNGGLYRDPAGTMWGTTYAGNIYKLDAGTLAFSNVYTFSGFPVIEAPLVPDSSGMLYGVTLYGGPSRAGSVFKFNPHTSEVTILTTFDGTNGSSPWGKLLVDAAGNIYGTTQRGGAYNGGTVFKIPANSNTIVTIADLNTTTGYNSYSGLVQDPSGNLYGTAFSGGTAGYGTLFKVAADTGSVTPLVSFNGANGYSPFATPIIDGDGVLFGTVTNGGAHGYGAVYKYDTYSNQFSLLVSFDSFTGGNIVAGLTPDADGNLYGATRYGQLGSGAGSVFKITNSTFVPIPEPASISVLVLALPLFVRRRRGTSQD